MNHICTCNHCGEYFIDLNPSGNNDQVLLNLNINELVYVSTEINDDGEIYLACENCLTDSFLMDATDKQKVLEWYWGKLGDIPVNEDEKIDEIFFNYQKGTGIYDIWHDVEEIFNISIGDTFFKSNSIINYGHL